MLKNHRDENSEMSSFHLNISTNWTKVIVAICLFALIVGVFFTMQDRTPPGLSIIGTMFWDGEPAETVSVILCPAGTVPGPSFFGIGGGCDEKSVPWTIIDASGKYRFYNIPSGKYTVFYKWPDEDDWNLGETTKRSFLVFVKEGSITKIDPISASRRDWLIEPKGILDNPSTVSISDQMVIFRWDSLKDAENYYIEIFERDGERIFFNNTTNPIIEVLLPPGNLSLEIRAYNPKKGLVGKEWYVFEARE